MRSGLDRFLICGLILAGLVASGAPAFARMAGRSEETIKQVALSEEKVQQFLAAAPALDALLGKVSSDTAVPDPGLLPKLNATAHRHGFADYADYDLVADNIVWILAGIDPLSKKYVGVPAVRKAEAALGLAGKSASVHEKRRESARHPRSPFESVAPLRYPANVALVLKSYDQLIAAMASAD